MHKSEIVLEIDFIFKKANINKLNRAVKYCNRNKDVVVVLNNDLTISLHSNCAEDSFIELLNLFEILIN